MLFGKDKKTIKENLLKGLGDFDTVIIVDDSGSMEGERWEAVSDMFLPILTESVPYSRCLPDRHVKYCLKSRPSSQNMTRTGSTSTSSMAVGTGGPMVLSSDHKTAKCDFIFSSQMTLY